MPLRQSKRSDHLTSKLLSLEVAGRMAAYLAWNLRKKWEISWTCNHGNVVNFWKVRMVSWTHPYYGMKNLRRHSSTSISSCLRLIHVYLSSKASGQGIHGVVGIHVDDGLGAGDQMFDTAIAKLEQKYPFGSKRRQSLFSLEYMLFNNGMDQLNWTKHSMWKTYHPLTSVVNVDFLLKPQSRKPSDKHSEA